MSVSFSESMERQNMCLNREYLLGLLVFFFRSLLLVSSCGNIVNKIAISCLLCVLIQSLQVHKTFSCVCRVVWTFSVTLSIRIRVCHCCFLWGNNHQPLSRLPLMLAAPFDKKKKKWSGYDDDDDNMVMKITKCYC